MNKHTEHKRADFILRLVALKDEAFRLGFIRTAHALDEATTLVGYEFADIRTGKQADTAEGKE